MSKYMGMRLEPELGGCTIVLLGRFSPAMFSPLWFFRNNLISEETADSATVEILHQDIAIVAFGKLRMQIEAGRFTAETTEAPWIDLGDFVSKTFTERLISTPINQMGINRVVHFSVGSEEMRNQIGRTLAPIEPWGDFGKAVADTKPPRRGGCVDVTMRLPTSGDGYIGHMQVSVQPSGRLKGDTGIYVQTNDHYDVGKLDEITDCEAIMNLLIDNFERSTDQSERIIDQIMSLGTNK
jgi:hypothetical protein